MFFFSESEIEVKKRGVEDSFNKWSVISKKGVVLGRLLMTKYFYIQIKFAGAVQYSKTHIHYTVTPSGLRSYVLLNSVHQNENRQCICFCLYKRLFSSEL